MSIGYTKKQAEALILQIDHDMVVIEDAALRMKKRVTDVSRGSADVERHLESLREVAYELKEIVERRTL